MSQKALKEAVLTSTADFFNGTSVAWLFVAYDALFHAAWIDLLYAVALAILTFSVTVGIKTKLYDKHSRSN